MAFTFLIQLYSPRFSHPRSLASSLHMRSSRRLLCISLLSRTSLQTQFDPRLSIHIILQTHYLFAPSLLDFTSPTCSSSSANRNPNTRVCSSTKRPSAAVNGASASVSSTCHLRYATKSTPSFSRYQNLGRVRTLPGGGRPLSVAIQWTNYRQPHQRVQTHAPRSAAYDLGKHRQTLQNSRDPGWNQTGQPPQAAEAE